MNKVSSNLPKVVRFDFNKHLPQSSVDKTNDLFFILATLYLADKEEKEITKLELEKALFKTMQELAYKNYSFLNTFFYINTFGPHNNIFYQYLEELKRAGLIEVEGRNTYLTPKGLRVISDIIDDVAEEKNLITVLLTLKQSVKDYSQRASHAVEETHAQKVVDTTDKNKIKTIHELIDEIKPEQEFERGQFKYIDPFVTKQVIKATIPSKTVNELETILANVEDSDFEEAEELNTLFA